MSMTFDITENVVRRAQAIRTAERETAPILGNNTLAFDSAADCYRTALKQMGVDTKGVHSSGLRQVFLGHLRNGRRHSHVSADLSGFPSINRIAEL